MTDGAAERKIVILTAAPGDEVGTRMRLAVESDVPTPTISFAWSRHRMPNGDEQTLEPNPASAVPPSRVTARTRVACRSPRRLEP
ncbi:hypothetical protein [Actinomadura sp. K4S16]|uniref:hypothetical protein n=1 Tax=Actinomadura sp. K4S16 TaxID=1316147 RepID=UPI00190F3054|nr:hypothetical protein [Actinomadura sp. K4S16]